MPLVIIFSVVDCIEVQFDEWQRTFLDTYVANRSTDASTFRQSAPVGHGHDQPRPSPVSIPPVSPIHRSTLPCTPMPCAQSVGGARAPSTPAFVRPGISAVALHATSAPSITGPRQFFDVYLRDRFCAENTRMLPVKSNQELTPLSSRRTKEMSLSTCGPDGDALLPNEYATGDHIAVYPTNTNRIVNAYLSRLDLTCVNGDPSMPVTLRLRGKAAVAVPTGMPGLSVSAMLAHYVDLTSPPTPKGLRWLASFAEAREEQLWIHGLSEVRPRRTRLDNIHACSL